MTAVEKVQFHGDTLDCVRQDARVMVSTRRVCESLGVDHASQWRKLTNPDRCPWACVVMMTTHDASGRQQELSVIDLDSLPMWLATIDVSRVKKELRKKLADYQRECARVLRDHFFGRCEDAGGSLSAKVASLEAGQARILAVLDRQQTFALTGPRWTVEQRCHELRWHESTSRQRAAVRRIANEMLASLYGEEPIVEFQHCFYIRHQIPVLDRAIEVVREAACRADRGGLFDEGRPQLSHN